MDFTKDLVDKFAKDLLIGLTPEENKMVLDEFKVIESGMDKIANIPNISEEDVMTHPLEYDSVSLRDDLSVRELSTEEVLQNAKYKTEEEIIVPKVVM